MNTSDKLATTRPGGHEGRKERTVENITTATVTVPVNIPDPAPKDNGPKRLTYSRREAAMALGVSLPTLDAFMNRRENPLPRIRQGYKLTLIPVAALEQWVLEEAARTAGQAVAR